LVKISRLVVGKGQTTGNEQQSVWNRTYYELEAVLTGKENAEDVRKQLEALLDKWLKSESDSPAQPAAGKPNGENIETLFPKDLRGLLLFEKAEGFHIIKPRQFLGSENFARIADIVRAKGGEYISAGKESHFRIPVK